MNDQNVRSYINRIRNPRKQAYARTYYAHLLSTALSMNQPIAHPERPTDLSLMAAQAVEIHLRKLAKPYLQECRA